MRCKCKSTPKSFKDPKILEILQHNVSKKNKVLENEERALLFKDKWMAEIKRKNILNQGWIMHLE